MTKSTLALGSLAAALIVAATATEAQAQGAQDSAVAAVLRRAGVTPTEAAVSGRDPKARAEALDALERSYPLPRSVLDLENRLPPNPEATMNQLGLVRRPGAPLTDLSGSTPTSRQITDALAPR
jgi:hypothetical protein